MRSPGDSVARYTLHSLLGRGGMGEVYEAEDKVLERRVALKLLPADGDAEARLRMLREARAAAAFEHPNVVTVFDAGLSDEGGPEEQAYIAMELVRGSSLRSFVGDETTPLAVKIGWLADVARALAAAEAAGLIHRDIKPDNVMVRRDGRVKVLDFGVAKRSAQPFDASAPTEIPKANEPSLTARGAFVGTPRYASPEQLRGEPLDARSDQYSWGMTAYELLSGEAPFAEDQGLALVSKILSSPIPDVASKVPGLPAEVAAAVMRALSKAPAERFSSLSEAAQALEPYAERASEKTSLSEGGKTQPPLTRSHQSTAVRTARGAARIFFWIAAGLGTLIIAVIIFGIASGSGRLVFDFGPTSAKASSSAQTVSPPVVLSGFRCQSATLEPTVSAGPLAAVIGIGACSRLGIETGLPWGHEGARGPKTDLAAFTPVEVQLRTGSPNIVTIKVEGRSAEGSGPSPFDAMIAAVNKLAPTIAPRALSEAERKAWGADNDESARRIERTWRKLLVGDLEDPLLAVRELVASESTSPWSHAMACLVEARGGKTSVEACKKVLETLDRLPPHRAKALRGLALLIGDSAKYEEAIRLFRQASLEAVDDPDVSGLYGAVVLQTAPDEGFGVVDGVAQRFPTYAVLPLNNAVNGSPQRDAARNQKYLNRLAEILPEKGCLSGRFDDYLHDSKLAEAKEQLALCTAVYGTGDTIFASRLLGAELALASLDPERARELAQPALADGREVMRSAAMALVIAAQLQSGRIGAARVALDADMTRLRDLQDPRAAVQRGIALFRLNRTLREPVDPKLSTFLREVTAEDAALPDWVKTRLSASLLMASKASKPELIKAADEVVASKMETDAFYVIPLLRAAYGDKKALGILSSRSNVWTRARIVNALEYAELLAAEKAPQEQLEQQYKLAMIPIAFDVATLDKLIARLKLAALYQQTNRQEQAAELRKEVERALEHAEPGMRDKILALGR